MKIGVATILLMMAAVGFIQNHRVIRSGHYFSGDTSFPVAQKWVGGIRIGWDYRTLKKVSSSAAGEKYCGYARLIQLHNGSLLCIYEAAGNIVVVKSKDEGATWTKPIIVAQKKEGINMAVPDVLELKNHSLLACYNPRPYLIDASRKFAIKIKKSYDGGLTWKDERLLYEGDYRFENGCWEPSAIQLPNGEIQLFFANEGTYTTSDEQNISLLRSRDNGFTWTKTPEIASFRKGKRDGMPSPLLLKNGKEIVYSIEDNGTGNFKPYIIRNSLQDNWSNIVTAESVNRNYALADTIAANSYAGAPYLRQFQSGETILSYQGTEGRTNKMSFAEMKVVIGDEEARNFNRKSVPFNIPENKSGLWNSISILRNNTVIALTSTNAYSANTEVWMIKGYVIPELQARRESLAIDGKQRERLWRHPFPVFIGQKGFAQARGAIAYDDRYLYIAATVKDTAVFTASPLIENGNGIAIYIDAANRADNRPGKGIFQLMLSVANRLSVKEGSSGQWLSKTGATGVRHAVQTNKNGYVVEMAIPWKLLGGKPKRNTPIGFDMNLTKSSGNYKPGYTEHISGNMSDRPYSWLTLLLQ